MNSAVGDAASASMLTGCSSRCGGVQPLAATTQPAAMAHGSGFVAMPFSACSAARSAPCAPAAPRRDSAMHSDEVMTMSIASAAIAGAAARWPSRPTSSGTPMKPELGKAATSAPKAASFQPTAPRRVSPTASATIASAQPSHRPNTAGSNMRAIGVAAAKRNSRHGSAKYRTNRFSAGIDSSGSQPRRATAQPTSTSAKKGKVTSRICSHRSGAPNENPMFL